MSACTRFDLRLYIAQIRTNTKIPSIPVIHEWKNWKNHKKKSNGGLNGQRGVWKVGIFAAYEISCSAPFFPLFALLSFWDPICNNEFNSNSSCLN